MKKKLNCVLLVDDDIHDNFFHEIVLKKAGITDQIEIKLNGREALDFLITDMKMRQSQGSHCQPALIFLDINMPVMDGWEFLEKYRMLDNDLKDKVIIVILTTSLNPADKTRAEKSLEVDSFRNKPLTSEMLDEIMMKHFPD